MRMDLAEIALSLGCAPETILSQRSGLGVPAPELPDLDPRSLQEFMTQRKAAPRKPDGTSFETQYAQFEEKASWASFTPTGASIDSRKIKDGHLFFCLPGDRADGHDFALEAAKGGACAVIAARNPFLNLGEGDANITLPPVFLVKDPLKAMWRLAMCHRDTSLARVIGITGTAGKTSVKEVLAHILSLRGHTERNPMNLNNQIGLPLSMLNASAEASFWVVEAGISEARDMDELGSILRPDVALILNVGKGHLTGLGERGVAANKALLLDHIQPGGTALVSADYPELLDEVEKRNRQFAERGIELALFSAVSHEYSAWAEYLGVGGDLSGQFKVAVEGREFSVLSCFRGDFGGENVAAVSVAAIKMGLSYHEIEVGFSGAKLPGQRFNCRRYGSFTLVDDSYNANPLSSSRMINACRGMAKEADLPLFLVMGEMLELGDEAESSHVELGREMAAASPEAVFWKGGWSEAVLHGLRQSRYQKGFYPVSGAQDFSLLLEELELKGGLFLFKGSRRNNLERLVDILRERVAPTGEVNAL